MFVERLKKINMHINNKYVSSDDDGINKLLNCLSFIHHTFFYEERIFWDYFLFFSGEFKKSNSLHHTVWEIINKLIKNYKINNNK